MKKIGFRIFLLFIITVLALIFHLNCNTPGSSEGSGGSKRSVVIIKDIWTWESGSNTINQIGIYVTKGVATSTNIPGSRRESISWIDTSGNLWLFSGYGLDGTTNYGQLNDLWKYDGTNWTWISGSDTINQTGFYNDLNPANNIPGARAGSISWIDTSGNLSLFGGHGYDSTGNLGWLNDLWKYKP